MADLTVAKLVEAGLNPLSPAFVAATGGGDAIPGNKGRTFLHAKNGSGGSITVTATAQQGSKTEEGLGTLTRGNLAIAIPAGEERLIGPFPARAFNDVNGKVQITYSGVTSLTVKAFEVPTV